MSEHDRAADRGANPVTSSVSDIEDAPSTGAAALERREMLAAQILGDGRRLLDRVPSAIAVTDAARTVVLWNRRAERLFGVSVEEAVGQPLDTVVRAVESHTSEPVQVPYQQGVATYGRPDGTTVRAAWCVGPLLDDAGRNHGTIRTWLEIGTVSDDRSAPEGGRTGYVEARRRARSAEQSAQHERRMRERLEFLSRLDEAVLSASDYRKLMHEIAFGAVPRLGDWCTVTFVPEPGGAVEVEVAHSDPAKVTWARELQQRFPFQPDAPRGVPAVLRTGRMEFIRDIDDSVVEGALATVEDERERDSLRGIVRDLRPSSSIVVPLRTKRGVVGAIQFLCADSRRHYDNDDLTLAQAVAGRVADALDNAWHRQQHHTIAKTLQAALLPPRLPSVDEIDVAIRYWAAGAATDVGGDFYDLFRLTDRRWAVVIGDVCGTGPDAAAVTAIARHTIRAAARHGVDHAGVLQWVNDALNGGDRNLFCTLIFATLDKSDDGTWRFTSVAGGHPLPLIVRADGSAGVVGAPGTLLGVLDTVKATVTSTELGRGDTLVMYTDGITDVAPPYSLEVDALLDLLRRSAHRRTRAEEVAEGLGQEVQKILPIPERHDDVALVVLHLPG